MNCSHLLALFSALFALSASAALIVTAENIAPSPAISGGTSDGVGGLYTVGGVPPSYHHFVGQTFTATEGGTLYSASFIVINGSNNITGNDITVSIAPTLGGIPGESLDSSTIPYSAVPRTTALSPYQQDYSITAIFTGQVQIIAGQSYALTIGSLGDLGSHYRIWMPNDTNPYKAGHMFENEVSGVVTSELQDLFFRVDVKSIPEPAWTSFLFASSILGISSRRRR